MTWEYLGKPFDSEFPINHYGFIYCIDYEAENGTIYEYIGKKSFWKQKTLLPLKGYKRKRKSLIESNWRTYIGSCKDTKGMIPVSKRILHFCDSKRDLSYQEDKYIHLNWNNETLNLNENIAGRHFKDRLYKREGEWIKWYEKEVDNLVQER